MSEYTGTHSFSLDEWVHAVLGQSPAQISDWESYFSGAGLFMDPTIRQAVTDYLRADSLRDEPKMYEPFCIASNRILDFFQENTKAPTKPFLVKDLLFCTNDPIQIGLYHDGSRSPDVVLITQTVLNLIQKRADEDGCYPTTGVEWTDLFSIFEFKTSHNKNYGDAAIMDWCHRQNITPDELMSGRKLKSWSPSGVSR